MAAAIQSAVAWLASLARGDRLQAVFDQGLLVYHHQGRKVAYATVFRLGSMSLAAAGMAMAFGPRLPGACVGALSLSAGVVAEAAATRWMARHVVRALLAPSQPFAEWQHWKRSLIWLIFFPRAGHGYPDEFSAFRHRYESILESIAGLKD